MNKNKNREMFVTPSLLNVDKDKRLALANTLIDNGIKWIHYDVMDGKFVPNTAIEISELENIALKGKKHFKDAHLMVENPFNYFEQLDHHVDVITIHYEAVNEKELLKFLKDENNTYCTGLAIKPATEVKEIEKFLPYLHLVLVMSVEPGKGGQKFIPHALDKIKELNKIRKAHQYKYLIQVDGGINNITGPQAFEAGADACVAGTYLVNEPTKDKIQSILGNN